MRALLHILELAKQVLHSAYQLSNFKSTQEIESLHCLEQAVAAVEANQQHYQTLLHRYHQLVETRRQLIGNNPWPIVNQLVAQLSDTDLRKQIQGKSSQYDRITQLLLRLKRQGLTPAPKDIMHPVFRRPFQRYKQSYETLFKQYTFLLGVIRNSLPPSQDTSLLSQLTTICQQLQQLTDELNQIEALIRIRYEQQEDLHHQIKQRVKAIKKRILKLSSLKQPCLTPIGSTMPANR